MIEKAYFFYFLQGTKNLMDDLVLTIVSISIPTNG